MLKIFIIMSILISLLSADGIYPSFQFSKKVLKDFARESWRKYPSNSSTFYRMQLRKGSITFQIETDNDNKDIELILHHSKGELLGKGSDFNKTIQTQVAQTFLYYIEVRNTSDEDGHVKITLSQPPRETVNNYPNTGLSIGLQWAKSLDFGPVRNASVALYDIDNDGKDEIFIGTSKTLDDSFNEVKPAGLICLEDDGTIKWTRTFPAIAGVDVDTGLTYNTTSVTTAPFFSNIDDDPEMEIIIGVGGETYGDVPSANMIGQPGDKGGIYALEADGSIKWYHQTHDDVGGSTNAGDGRPDGVYGSPIVYDIDNDGEREVIYNAWDRRTHILDARTGKVEKEINLHDTIWSTPAIADINNDGNYEILVTADISKNNAIGTKQTGGIFHVISADGTQNTPGFNSDIAKPSYTTLRGKLEEQVLWSSPAVGDIDKDGFSEIVYGTGNYFHDQRGEYIRVWNHDGTLKFKLHTIGKPLATPLIVDIDNDGYLDIIAVTLEGYVYAWNHLGELIFSTYYRYGSSIFSSPIAVDIDNDGKLEIIYSISDEIIILNAAGLRINNFYSMKTLNTRRTPAIKDIDNDGTLDLIIGSGKRVRKHYPDDHAIVYRWSIDGSKSNARVGKYQLTGSNTDIRKFVSRFYKIVLGRDADVRGLNDWTDKLATGTYAGADIARGFIDSTEFDKDSKDDLDYVTTLYQAFFNRDPDTAGLDDWLDQLSNGTAREEILDGFLYSVEFANLSKKYNIKPVKGLSANIGIKKFVRRFYKEILGRNADNEGLNNWINSLSSGQSAGADIARGFIFSEEYTNKRTDNTSYVTTLYKAFFGRAPDTAGLNGWVNDLNGGKSRNDVLNGFLYSQEFKQLSQAYGILPVK